MSAPREGSAAIYDVRAEREIMVPMRDGVGLATDLYLPVSADPDERHPVLLERTPYSREDPDIVSTARFFARHGYAVALQDVRGRFDSEGEWYPFAEEAEDGVDTVEWLGSRPWSNGSVGTFGLSYSGSVQHALASLAPTPLAAMFVAEGTSNYHTTAMRQGGAMELRFLAYAFWMASESPQALADPSLRAAVLEQMDEIHSLLDRLPLKPGTTVLRHFPLIERWVLDVLTHGSYDDYWKQRGYSAEEYYDEHSDVPIYFLSGWYDTYPRAATDNFVAFGARMSSRMRLILGPWLHDILPLRDTFAGDVDFGIDSPLDYDAIRLRFFDETMKGLNTGLADEPPVRLFVMGGGSGRKLPSGKLDHGGAWRSAETWPLPETTIRTLHLHGDGRLDEAPPGAETPASSSYLFDPADPVPTVGGSISAADYVLPPGGFDQRGRPGLWGCHDELPLNTRQDVLTFQTDPLEEPVEVTGGVVVNLVVSSSAVDTDFTAKLIDVYPPSEDYPDGYALNLQDSVIRARYRLSRSEESFLTPGEPTEVQIALYPTSNLFAAGHRIRVDISSSNFPRFDVNPNTGAPLGTPGRAIVAENTVHHGAEHSSTVLLPVIPR